MKTVSEYLNDGAHAQAKAVLAYLGRGDGMEISWDKESGRYLADFGVARWYNGREQGYIVTLKSKNHKKQLNIAFFEHRNSDVIVAIRWEQYTVNFPTIETAKFGDVYKNKYDVSKEVENGQVLKMANWIEEQFQTFWLENLE